MKKIIAALLLCLLMINLSAQDKILKPGNPAEVRVSAERLKRVDQLMQSQIDSGRINGGACLIARDGKIIYDKAFGFDDLGKKIPMKNDAIFRIASQTKTVVSVAAMMLFEEGKFLLDDSVAKYIPAFANARVLASFNPKDSSYTTVPAKRPITIRDLLTHTSGIDYAQISPDPAADAIYAKNGLVAISKEGATLAELIPRLGKLPLFHQPGEKYTYGLNHEVLGYLVEIWSGMSLDAFLRKRIFEPLGMNDTYFYLPASKQNRLVTAYSCYDVSHLKKWDTTFWPFISADYPLTKGTYYAGGGGLSGTISDFSKFAQMLLNNGVYNGHRFLSRHTIQIMTMNQIGDINFYDTKEKWGLGFNINTAESEAKLGQSAGSYGWSGFFSTTYWVDPKEHLIALLYLQQFPVRWDLFDLFKVAVYQSLDD